MTKRVSGKARGHKVDEAEAWLAQHDPEYAQRKKSWQAPSTDVLSRVNSEANEVHGSLEPLVPFEPRTGGNYYRRRPNAEAGTTFDYSDTDTDEL